MSDKSLPFNLWTELPPPFRQVVEQAAEEIALRIEEHGRQTGRAFSEAMSWMLRNSVYEIGTAVEEYSATHSAQETNEYGEGYRELLRSTLQKSIVIIRELVVQDKKSGSETVKVRRGLRLPVWWEERYELIYNSNYPCTVSSSLQSAFLGSPELGEKKPWTSR